MATDGSDLFRVTTHPIGTYYIEPSFSPDGQWIVFEVDPDAPESLQQGSIWKVHADGTALTQLTNGPSGGTDDRQPNWSPAGDRILFQRRPLGSDDWDLYTMASDGSDIRQVTVTPSSDTDASWSPDGRWIVYSSDYGGLPVPNIFVISAGGGAPIHVTQDDVHEDGAPSWSPNGEWIAFESHVEQNENSPSTLWRIVAPGRGCREGDDCVYLPTVLYSADGLTVLNDQAEGVSGQGNTYCVAIWRMQPGYHPAASKRTISRQEYG